ncbi:MAG TPA: CoA transferase [Acidimicrobiia bacterium]|jgi:crotonobetainyl-CoA:carnitine CoA-transferase CaiB-like acyl-CoA transferase
MSSLSGLRVLQLVDERTVDAGRILAELGAEVVVVEPAGGSPLRDEPPFVSDEPGPERSLRWWAGAAGARSIELDLEGDGLALFDALLDASDLVLEGRGHALDAVDAGWDARGRTRPSLIWVSITPFGRNSVRADDPATDLTLLAGGGPVWNCGYDDHSIPPMRGKGNQAYNIGAMYAVIGALTALAHRDRTGRGQLVDVNINAACNVTAEHVTYNWLVVQSVMSRQTGRHASSAPTAPVQVRCADGRYATTGVLPRSPAEFGRLRAWLDELGLLDRLPEAVFLDLAARRTETVEMVDVASDPEVAAILAAARDAMTLIASELPAYDFYVASQQHGFPCGAVVSPDEAFEDPQFAARGFVHEVDHPELERPYRAPGVAYVFSASPCPAPERAPLLDEHRDELLGSMLTREDERWIRRQR